MSDNFFQKQYESAEQLDKYINGNQEEDYPNEHSRYLEEKSRLNSCLRNAQMTISNLSNNNDKLNRQKRNLQSEKDNLTLKYKELEKKYKELNEKFQLDKTELIKEIKNLEGVCKQHEHTNRQKEKQIKTLKDGYRKYQQKIPLKNNFQLYKKIQQHGPPLYMTNADNQYNNLSVQSIEELISQLSKENQYIKDCLINTCKQLESVLELKKETLRKRNGGYDTELENSFQLISFKPQKFNLPEFWNRQAMQNMNTNIQKFKEVMSIGDNFDSRVQNRKQDCVKGVKDVLRNYKEIVHTQDQILNKVMLRAKEFKGAQELQIQNRYSNIMDNQELERARNFLDEQSRYLTSKNSELQRTRKAMQQTMRKAEQSKNEMLRKRKEFEDEALTLRKQVQILPAVIEQQLRKES